MFGGSRFSLQPAFALALSLLLHLSLGALFVSRFPRRFPEPPIEVSIFGGRGADPGVTAGERHAATGSVPSEARAKAPRRPAPHDPPLARRAARRRPPPSAAPAIPEDEGVRRKASAEKPSSADASAELDSKPQPPPRPTGPEARLEAGPSGEGAAASGAHPPLEAAASGGGRGGFSVSGTGAGGSGRSYASIWNWTQRYLSGLRGAYDRELEAHPRLRGVMVVRYEILASGAVGDVAVLSTELRAPRLERGVLSQIREWRYPPEPSGNVVVTWPFSFEPPR